MYLQHRAGIIESVDSISRDALDIIYAIRYKNANNSEQRFKMFSIYIHDLYQNNIIIYLTSPQTSIYRNIHVCLNQLYKKLPIVNLSLISVFQG